MKTIKTGVIYFVLVFGAGFILGIIRTILIVPRLGARTAELLEIPFMIAIIVIAARWIIKRYAVPPGPAYRLGMGLIALGLLLTAEFSLVLWLRGMTISAYFATIDLVSGTAYYASFLLLAALPILVARESH